MLDQKFTEFEALVLRSKNEVGTAVLLVLSWIAASDGVIDDKEAKQLSDISVASRNGHGIAPILHLAMVRDIKSLQLASEIIARHFKGRKAPLFMEMAIGVSIVDGYLSPTENFILRFLADLLGLSSYELNALFLKVTDQKIPSPSDISSASYWRNRKESQSKSEGKEKAQSAPDTKLAWAYAVLGLEHGAAQEDVRKAFRRLAQVHHPDRFSSLGEESVAAATITFQRINEAYNYLVKYA